jgi:hypothetical protein
MIGLFVGIISILLFFTAILCFPLLHKKYDGMPASTKITLGGIVLFAAYIVFQTAYYIYSVDDFFGLCSSVLAIGGLFLIVGMNNRLSTQSESVRPSVFSVTLVVCLVGSFLPAYAAKRIETFCADKHERDAGEIIEALKNYGTSENKSPDNLISLIPEYLEEVPSPKCFSVYRPLVPILTNTEFLRSMNYWVMRDLIKLKQLDYHLTKCEWEEDNVIYKDLYLIVPTVDLASKDRYDFSTRSWRKIPFYYDECSGSVPS